MPTYTFSASPEDRILRIADDVIDVSRLTAFALEIEQDYRGSYGNDNLGDFGQERPPTWSFELTIRSKQYAVDVVKLRELVSRKSGCGFTVTVAPKAPCPPTLKAIPELEDVKSILFKHTGSQLPDGYFRIGRHHHTGETWIVADRSARLDSALLTWIFSDLPPEDRVVFSMGGEAFRVQRREGGLVLMPFEGAPVDLAAEV